MFQRRGQEMSAAIRLIYFSLTHKHPFIDSLDSHAYISGRFSAMNQAVLVFGSLVLVNPSLSVKVSSMRVPTMAPSKSCKACAERFVAGVWPHSSES